MSSIFASLLLEACQALGGRVRLCAVAERCLSRLLCHALRALAKKSSNSFTRETAEAFIEALKRDDLPAIK